MLKESKLVDAILARTVVYVTLENRLHVPFLVWATFPSQSELFIHSLRIYHPSGAGVVLGAGDTVLNKVRAYMVGSAPRRASPALHCVRPKWRRTSPLSLLLFSSFGPLWKDTLLTRSSPPHFYKRKQTSLLQNVRFHKTIIIKYYNLFDYIYIISLLL